jgi:NAD(P)-dependent dehydrogenase (short-subunit alcohol dehydrogenase family)
MNSLKNKIVVITGATRGFGYHIAKAMLKAGATVVISGRSLRGLENALNGLKPFGPVSGEICDVRNESQVHALADAAVARHGQIDIWINNAGYSSAAGRIIDFDPQEALEMFLINDLGAMYGTQAAFKTMLPRRSGMLINVYGNGSFLRPASPAALYGTSKAWMTSFTRSLAVEHKDSGVQILGFSPGMMLTDMLTFSPVLGEQGMKMMERYGFVLRFLARPTQESVDALMKVVQSNNKPFMEYRVIKPWTPLLGLLRVAWENLTKTGKTPEYTLEYKEIYHFEGQK